MDMTVYTKVYDAPPFNKKEILRYAGVTGDVAELDELLQTCIDEVSKRLTYKVCYCELPVKRNNDRIELGPIVTSSKALLKNLSGCHSTVLFAATVGVEIDRAIARHSALSPTKALLFQAIGAERIESLCEIFDSDIKEEKARSGYFTSSRFSAGYGDLPLELQRDIFTILDCPRKIGLTLNDSLLMSPSKSVTAIIGVGSK